MVMRRYPSKSVLLAGVLLCSAAGVAAGFLQTFRYEGTPGRPAAAGDMWPEKSALHRSGGKPTLVLALHPECPCSKATVAELARMLSKVGEVNCYALFESVADNATGGDGGGGADVKQSGLWKAAAAIPGVQAIDDRAREAVQVFGAETSGQVLVYSPEGKLVFQGGITDGRGHEGDNDGLNALETYLLTGKVVCDRTPVYGCSLH
jgi:hypothetical protein